MVARRAARQGRHQLGQGGQEARQRSRRVWPLAPITVETIRINLGLRDATLVSVLAYAGLRPGEAFGLQWQKVREGTILVDRSVSLGREKGIKTNATRTVRLVPALVEDVASGCARRGRRRTTSSSSRTPTACPGPRTTTRTGAGATMGRRPRRGPRRSAPVRPAPLVRVAADPRGRLDRRGSPPGRPRSRGVPAHVRAHLRGVRPGRQRARGGCHQSRARGGSWPQCTCAVRADLEGRFRGARICLYRPKPTERFEPSTPALPRGGNVPSRQPQRRLASGFGPGSRCRARGVDAGR